VTISKRLRDRIRRQADDRCGYCLSPQKLVLGQLEIEHLVPRALGGKDDEDNLWLACRMCNGYKGKQIKAIDPQTDQPAAIFNPRKQNWSEHFQWSEDGSMIIGLTPTGRATVEALQLNNPLALVVRLEWVSAGWHPPG
jgi:hypothetical protein